jgi:hypothetical protein
MPPHICPAASAIPELAARATLTFRIIDTFFVWAPDNRVDHRHACSTVAPDEVNYAQQRFLA